MKRLLLIGVLFVVLNIHAQNIQLPGMGSADLQWSSTQITAATQLSFSNPEYHVTGFTLSFPTSANPNYVAIATGDHFTQEMLTNIPLLVSGEVILLDITLKAPGEGHDAWHKNYQIHLN